MGNISWKNGTGGTGLTGSWDTPANWSTGATPSSGDTVTIADTGSYTITINGGADGCGTLLLNAAGATLVDASPEFFTVSQALTIKAGTFEVMGDTQVSGNTAGTFTLSSGGTLLAGTGGGDVSFKSVNVGGLISLGTNVLALDEFNGGTGSLGGTISGTGTLRATGSYMLAAGGIANASATLKLGEDGVPASLSAATSATIGGTVVATNLTLSAASGANIMLSGAVSLGTAGESTQPILLTGGGTITTAGTTTVTDLGAQSVTLGGGTGWSNSGVVNDAGQIGLNASGSSGDSATITNLAAGIFNIVGSNGAGLDGNIVLNASGSDVFTNAGTLTRGGDTATSTIASVFNDTGTVNVTSGTLALSGGGSIAGTLNGAGSLLLGSGAFQVGAYAGNGHLVVGSGASVTYVGTPVFAGNTTLDGYDTITIMGGKTVTYSGTLTIGDASGGATVASNSGPGTFATSGITTLADLGPGVVNLTIESGNIWSNTGTVTAFGQTDFGNPAAFSGANDSGTLVNKGVFNLAGDDALIMPSNGYDGGTITNTGTLAKISGTGTNTLAVTFNNTGVVAVVSGTIALTAGGTLGGTLSGAGDLLAASTVVIASGGLAGTGTLGLGATGELNQNSNVTVAANILATGGGFASSGVLTTTGTTTIIDGGQGVTDLKVDGGTWANGGTVIDAGQISLFPAGFSGSGSSAYIANRGVFTFTTDDSGVAAGTGSGSFTNSGTLAKSGGAGVSTIVVPLLDTGLITVASGSIDAVGGGTLGGTLSGAGTLGLGGGFTTKGVAGGGHIALMSASSLTGTATGTIACSLLVEGGGTLAVSSAVILTQSGALTLGDAAGASGVTGPGTLVTTGVTSIFDNGGNPEAIANGGIVWKNAGTINEAGVLYFSYPGTGGATLANTGTLNLTTSDSSIILADSSVVNTITSSGLLEKTGATGTSTISVATTSTGAIAVTTGTLALTGGGGVTGSLTGPGQLDLGGGTFNSAGISGAGNLAINGGAVLTETANGTFTVATLIDGGGTLTAANAVTLTETGNLTLGDTSGVGTLSGPGTITTTGTTAIGDNAGNPQAVLSGGLTWNNSGTITDAGLVYFSYPGTGGATLANTGTLNLTTSDSNIVVADSSVVNTITSAGLLEKTGGTGVSTISVATTSTGAIAVTTGTLALTGGGGITGSLTGAGQLDLGGGTFTTKGISGTGNLAINGAAVLTETANGTFTVATLIDGGGTLTAANAVTLTETGNLTLGDTSGVGTLSGPGTITTTGTTAIGDNAGNPQAVLSGGLTWNNSGTITDAGLVYFSYPGTGGATLANTGTLNLTTSDSNIVVADSSVVNTITSAGLLEKTGGTGVSTISVATTSTGAIAVTTGTLALTGGGGITGSLTGAGQLDLGGGTFTTKGISGTGNLAINGGAVLTETANGTFTVATLIDGGGTLTAANAVTLTETGNLTLGDASGVGTLSGPGTITTTGTTAIGDNAGNPQAVLSGGLTWNNSGTITDAGLVYFSYPGTGGATLANTGTLNLTTSDSVITVADSSVPTSLTNAGLLEKTGAATTSVIAIAVANTGTIEAASGTLVLQQAVTGAGHLKIDSGATLETSLAIPASQQIAFAGGAGATLKLDTVQSIGTLTNFTAGDRLDLTGAAVSSVKISGTTLTVVTSSATYTYVSAGIAGEVVTSSDDGNNGTYVSLYRGAIPTHTPEPLAFGNFHVGSTNGTLAHLTVTNNAPADGYSEKLNASLGGATAGFTASGAFSLLAAGASNATALSATISTATAGAKTGTATLTLNSNGSGVDGRGLTALPSQTVHFTGGVYNYAAAGLASTTINLGHQHVGAAQSTALTLTNTAAAGGFSEGLDASFTGSSGGATGTGTVAVLAAGSTATGLSVGFAATGSGTLTGTETLTYVSDGAGTSGLGTTTLGTQAVSVTGTFYNLAAAAPGTTTIAFGNHHVGDTVAAQSLRITNSAPAGAFSEVLDAGFASATAGLTATGSITNLAAGASATSLAIAESTAAAGALTGSAVLALVSDGTGIDGLGTTTLAGQTITVTGANYALAAGSTASSTLALGIIHAGTAASATLGLTNIAATGGYSEALDAGLSGATAGLSASGSITGLLAGQADTGSLRFSVNTAATGAYTGSALLGLVSDGNGIDGLGTTALAGQTITVTATVDNYAVATLEDPSGPALTGTSTSETLNLGSVLQNGAALTAVFGALNGATGTADLLGGSFASAGGAGFTNSGLGSFSGLSAGQDEHAQSVSLSTGTAGTFSETVTLSSYGTNASGYLGALAPETLTIIGTITASVFHTYTLASQGPNIIQGADGSGDIFIATAASINSHDVLSGGAGANSVTLAGAGQFDFGALKAGNFTNIPTLNATEGQAAMGTLAATTQLIYLNDSTAETLTVAAGTAASGNTNAEAITIYGSEAANTIALAAGADQVFLGTGAETVILGGAANQVTAGGGRALIRGTAAAASAAITGTSTGTTRLEVTTGGAVTLNAADTNLTVQLDSAATLKLSAMSFITALGSTGADTITAGATGQALTGGAGIDMLAGYTGGNDTFRDTAAGLNGDTIKGWTTGDTIDLTNISSATLKALSFTNNVLNVSDGHTASSIHFAAGLTVGNFTVLGSDGSGGVLIGFHS